MKKVIVFMLSVFLFLDTNAQTEIRMEKQNGVYFIPCKVNGLQLNFIFDTGASSVSISITEAIFMLKNGYLSEEDLLGTEYYTFANGEVAEGTSIMLKEIEIGDLKLYNVKASIVHELDAPLLLGQTALSKLGKFNFDYANNLLTFSSGGHNIKPAKAGAHQFSSVYYPDKDAPKNKFLQLGVGVGLERSIFNEYAQCVINDGMGNIESFDSSLIRINAIGIKGEFAAHPLIKENFSLGFVGSYSIGTKALIAGNKEKAGDDLTTEIKYFYTKLNLGGEIAGGFKTAKLLYKLNWSWQTNDYTKTFSGNNNYSEVYTYDYDFDHEIMAFGVRFGGYARYYPGMRGNTVDFTYILARNISPGYTDNAFNKINGLSDWNVGFGFMWWCQSAFKFQFDVITNTKHKNLSNLNFTNAWYQISLIYNHNWFY